MPSTRTHWDTLYTNADEKKVGWYEAEPIQTLELLDQVPNWEQATIFIPGIGTSILAETLLVRGVRLVLNDISQEALDRLRRRLGATDSVDWLCQDIAQPLPSALPQADLWIDRAVLHFLTDEAAINGYFDNLRTIVRAGGHVILAEYSTIGAPQCAGLTLHRYDLGELSARLGDTFTLKSQFEYTFIAPNGDPKPYIYTLYQRNSG